jgi:hypothetical protein
MSDVAARDRCRRLADAVNLSVRAQVCGSPTGLKIVVWCGARWTRDFNDWNEASDFLLEIAQLFGDGPHFPWGSLPQMWLTPPEIEALTNQRRVSGESAA